MHRSQHAVVLGLAFTVLAAPGCSTPGPADSGMIDTGTVQADARVDTGVSPTDIGMVVDTGTPLVDTGVPPTDMGTPPTDTGTPPGDAGTGSTAFFPPGTEWDRDVSSAMVDSESAAVITWLGANGGWGNGNIMQIDFSIEVLRADATTPMRTFTRTADFYTPDCDHVPMPIPAGGAIEGEAGYTCVGDGDCHLLVVHEPTHMLYEMWRANIIGGASGVGGTFNGGCTAVWDLSRRYAPTGRGDQCTSADAAGFPISPLLFTADEVAAGAINHAIRFILPNPRMRRGVFVRPATHVGAPSGPATAPPYGARFRLRADYPLASLPNEGARVVARALQRYGMLLSDGGNIALTARSDRSTTARWAGMLAPRDLQMLRVSDFQMISAPRVPYTGDCVRNP